MVNFFFFDFRGGEIIFFFLTCHLLFFKYHSNSNLSPQVLRQLQIRISCALLERVLNSLILKSDVLGRLQKVYETEFERRIKHRMEIAKLDSRSSPEGDSKGETSTTETGNCV